MHLATVLRSEVNTAVQTGLAANGEIGPEATTLTVLSRVNATREELRFASTYRTGQVVEARMDVREIGLGRGEYQVSEVRKDGKVVLERDGKRKVIDPDRINPDHRFDRLGLYEQKQIRIHDGETVFWRDKDMSTDVVVRPEGPLVEL